MRKKQKNIIYFVLLTVFLIVVGIRTFQNIYVIEKIYSGQNAGIEDVSIANILNYGGSGGGGGEGGSPLLVLLKTAGEGGSPLSVLLKSCICSWANLTCGASPCSGTQMKQVTVCSPSGCSNSQGTTQCVANPTCNGNAAKFISQYGPPSVMQTSQTVPVSIIMQNTGTTAWTKANGYSLNSQNPPNNIFWGISRVDLNPTESIGPGDKKTFSFTVTAPSSPGTYNFTWQMIQNGNWFGDITPNPGSAGGGGVIVTNNWGCDGGAPDGFCSKNENQTACPSDCYSNGSMSPNVPLYNGQPVIISVNFSDGRYVKNNNIMLDLTVLPDQVVWNTTNGCVYSGSVLSPTGSGPTTKWSANTISNDLNFSTTFACYTPVGLVSGIHSLAVKPVFFPVSS